MNVSAIYNSSPRRDSSWLLDSSNDPFASNQFTNFFSDNVTFSSPIKSPSRNLNSTSPQAQTPKSNRITLFDTFSSPFSSSKSSQINNNVYDEPFSSSFEAQTSSVDEDFELPHNRNSYFSGNGFQPQAHLNIIYAPHMLPSGTAFTPLDLSTDPSVLTEEHQQSSWLNLAANAAASLFNTALVVAPIHPGALPLFYPEGLPPATSEDGFKTPALKTKSSGLDSSDSTLYSQLSDFSGFNPTPSQFLSNGFLCGITPISISNDDQIAINNETDNEETVEEIVQTTASPRKKTPDSHLKRHVDDDEDYVNSPTIARVGRKGRRKGLSLKVNTKKSKVKKQDSPVVKRYNRKSITESWVRKTNAIESPFEPVDDVEYDDFEDDYSPSRSSTTGSNFSTTEAINIHDTPLSRSTGNRSFSAKLKSLKAKSKKTQQQSKEPHDMESDLDDIETASTAFTENKATAKVSSLGKLTAVSNMLLKRLSDTAETLTSPTNSSGSSLSSVSSLSSSSPAPSTVGGAEDMGALIDPFPGPKVKKSRKIAKSESLKDQIQESLEDSENLRWIVETNENGKMSKGFVMNNLDEWKCTWCLIPKKGVPALRRGPLGLK
ncbi:hypothetical protein HK098_003808, partial [Nowakowskiella sp. JEL0407]